jgi:DUF971 family protein
VTTLTYPHLEKWHHLRQSQRRARFSARSRGRLLSVLPCAHPSAGRERTMSAPQPTEITLHQSSRILEIAFSDGEVFRLPCEFLRVYSPSAEVRGHGPGQEVLQVGKKDVQIRSIEPVGSYAVRLLFSDGHDTGLYSWEYLHYLGTNLEGLWRQYIERMAKAGASRDASAAPTQSPPDPAAPTRTSAKPGWKKL